MSLAVYAGVEVSPVVGVDDDGNELSRDAAASREFGGQLTVTKDENNPNIFMWSVYGECDPNHPENCDFGGVEWIADFPTKKLANDFGVDLRNRIHLAKQNELANPQFSATRSPGARITFNQNTLYGESIEFSSTVSRSPFSGRLRMTTEDHSSPFDLDSETMYVRVSIDKPTSGSQRSSSAPIDNYLLTGDQWRDLESLGKFAEFVKLVSLDGNVSSALEHCIPGAIAVKTSRVPEARSLDFSLEKASQDIGDDLHNGVDALRSDIAKTIEASHKMRSKVRPEYVTWIMCYAPKAVLEKDTFQRVTADAKKDMTHEQWSALPSSALVYWPENSDEPMSKNEFVEVVDREYPSQTEAMKEHAAFQLLQICDWQHPETIISEETDDIAAIFTAYELVVTVDSKITRELVKSGLKTAKEMAELQKDLFCFDHIEVVDFEGNVLHQLTPEDLQNNDVATRC
ncbi:MAG: hypothetical protein Q7K26_01545 [bacterium]|nr:hypothetical protein [bacterium]